MLNSQYRGSSAKLQFEISLSTKLRIFEYFTYDILKYNGHQNRFSCEDFTRHLVDLGACFIADTNLIFMIHWLHTNESTPNHITVVTLQIILFKLKKVRDNKTIEQV
jgi:hypothetical protein